MVEVSILESLGSDNEQDGASRDNNSKDSIRSSLGKVLILGSCGTLGWVIIILHGFSLCSIKICCLIAYI
ncbi:hypothetical protein LINPERPRIM_LOCUS33597 [Linum perenne]